MAAKATAIGRPKKEAAELPGRPESREETPKEGICDKSLPHRNKIHLLRMKCKGFVRRAKGLARYATFLPQSIRGPNMSVLKTLMTNNGLLVSLSKTVFIFPQIDMTGMRVWHVCKVSSAVNEGNCS
jgi:hypothetical protein